MKLLILLMILCTSCASKTDWRPDVYGHDYVTREIIAPDHSRINTGDKEFNCYVSFSLAHLKKLALIVKHGKFPRHILLLIGKNSEKKIKEYKKGQSSCP